MTDPTTPPAAPAITAEMMARASAAALKAITRYDRTPFRRILADLIGAAPTPEALSSFAARYPDKWAQALSIVGGLAGFERGVTVNVNHYNVGDMSDAALLARAAELERTFRDAAPRVIEGEAEEVPAPAAEGVPGVPEIPVFAGREPLAEVNAPPATEILGAVSARPSGSEQ